MFETPDPEVWVPHGYVVVKVDSRGAGKSPGRLDVNSPAEFRDFYDAIEWAATQPWSNGKVGLLGISYYAAGQWMIAAERPPHLAAILPWQGTYDFYRDRTRQDGIFGSGFLKRWWNRSVLRNQHGNPDTPVHRHRYGRAQHRARRASRPSELAANREDYIANLLAHPLNDAWYAERSARLEHIDIPALVVANWGGLGLHLRGTILGYLGIASQREVAEGAVGLVLPHLPAARQRRAAAAILRPLPEGHRQRLGARAARSKSRCARPTTRSSAIVSDTQWPLPRNAMDAPVPRCVGTRAGRDCAGQGNERELRGDRRQA